MLLLINGFFHFDELDCGAKDDNTLIDNFEQIFLRIRNLEFKLSTEKCQFCIPKIQFFLHLTSDTGNRSNTAKIGNHLVPQP